MEVKITDWSEPDNYTPYTASREEVNRLRPLTPEERIELGLETDNNNKENIMTTEKHCRLLRNASSYAAGWLFRQPSLKEESITDWLLDYVQQHSTAIRYYLFDRIEEGASSGADWDWWFLLSDGCFKIRVQAKKIKKDKDHYKDLAHFNKKHFQIDLLLDSSARHNFYPIYGVYGFSRTSRKVSADFRPKCFIYLLRSRNIRHAFPSWTTADIIFRYS